MHLVEGPRIQPVTRLVLLYVGVTGNTNLDSVRKKMLMNTQEMRAARHELHRMGLHPGVGDEITGLQKIPEVVQDRGDGELRWFEGPPLEYKQPVVGIDLRKAGELEERDRLEAVAMGVISDIPRVETVPLKAADVDTFPVLSNPDAVRRGDVITIGEDTLKIEAIAPVGDEGLRESIEKAEAALAAVEQAEAHMRGFHNLVERLDKEEKDDAGREVRGEESESAEGDGGGPERARGSGDSAAGGQEPDPQADHEAGPPLGDGAGPVVAVSRRKGKGKSHV